MMTLQRYVLRDVVKPTAVTMLILVGLIWLLQSLRFLDLVINKGLDFSVFLYLTAMLIPKLLTLILPISMFVATCVMLRRWQEDNELTAVLSLGRSPRTVMIPLMAWAFAGVALGYGLFLYLLPASTTIFKDLQYQIRTQNGQLLLEEGTFNQLGKNLMVYLKQRTSPTTMEQVLVHDTRKPEQPVTWYARSGDVTVSADGYPQLVLHNGLRQEVGPKNVGMLEFTTYNLDIRQNMGQQVLQPRSREHEEYNLAELEEHSRTDTDVKSRNQLRAELHKRLLWPLSPIPLMLLAAAWLLRPPKRQQSSWKLLMATSLSGFAYIGALIGIQGISEGGVLWALYGQWALPPLGIAMAWWIAKCGRING